METKINLVEHQTAGASIYTVGDAPAGELPPNLAALKVAFAKWCDDGGWVNCVGKADGEAIWIASATASAVRIAELEAALRNVLAADKWYRNNSDSPKSALLHFTTAAAQARAALAGSATPQDTLKNADSERKLAVVTEQARRWKDRAEYEYGLRAYRFNIGLAAGALDASMAAGWAWDSKQSDIDEAIKPDAFRTATKEPS